MFRKDFVKGIENNKMVNSLKNMQKESSEVLAVCAQIEQEIAELNDDEKKIFRRIKFTRVRFE